MATYFSSRILTLGALALFAGLLISRVAVATDEPASQPSTKPATQAATHPALPRIVVTEDVALAFFQKYEPDVYQQMMVLKEKDKAKYNDLMKDFYREVGRLLDLQRKNEPLFNITMEDRRVGFATLQLARTIQSGTLTGPDLDKANTELNALLSKQFDLRQQIRAASLEEQKARLAEFQRMIDTLTCQFSERAKSKDELIKQRYSDLMQKNPKTEW